MNAAIKGRTAASPYRQDRAPVALLLLSHADLMASTLRIAARIAEIGRARGCCAYVFVRDGSAYVLSEEHPQAHRWAVINTSEWAGCYGGKVDIEQLEQDLRHYL